ncbi:aldose epimerase family protein [Spirosoma pollinicola]|uniref:Aldose 1-epimerase n=1 Tax=Spirosoma pollinicola TaxID=2057025 RepID=A0A2K8YV07_9BACT|nr:aldose epimerase family protein [Spirosoma pollinicola]AUD01414.1 galactose-1-epimerase [Spirosoma pollinicola]
MSQITSLFWGEADQVPVYLFRITNSSGAYVEFTNYGATLVTIYVPDRHDHLGNVILSYDSLAAYVADTYYLGSTIGRFANRIKGARFTLDEYEYALDDNDNGQSNHGGYNGFNRNVFTYTIDEQSVSFTLTSKDGDGGYPGTLDFTVNYRWNDENELTIDYRATSDRTTVANFTNHAYFNLSAGARKILDHQLSINARYIVEAGDDYIPTGQLIPAGQLTFDANAIRSRVKDDGHTLAGLNVCYVLEKTGGLFSNACRLFEPVSGRLLEVDTSYPGMILYTGDYLSGNEPGSYGPFDGLCLECQYFPDSPNQPHFPDTRLYPGETYHHRIVFRFSVMPGSAPY